MNSINSFKEEAPEDEQCNTEDTGDDPSATEYSTFGGDIDLNLANSDAYNRTQEKVDLDSLSKSANVYRKNKPSQIQDENSKNERKPEENNPLFRNEHVESLESGDQTNTSQSEHQNDIKSPNFGKILQQETANIFIRDSFGIQTREAPDMVNSQETSLMKLLGKPLKSDKNKFQFDIIKEEGEYQELKHYLKNEVYKKVKSKIEEFLERKMDVEDNELIGAINKICDEEFDKHEQELNVNNGGSLSFRDINKLRSIDTEGITNRMYDLLKSKVDQIKEGDEKLGGGRADKGIFVNEEGKGGLDSNRNLVSQRSFENVSNRSLNKSGYEKRDEANDQKFEGDRPENAYEISESKLDNMASGLVHKMTEDVQKDILDSEIASNMASQFLNDLNNEVEKEMMESMRGKGVKSGGDKGMNTLPEKDDQDDQGKNDDVNKSRDSDKEGQEGRVGDIGQKSPRDESEEWNQNLESFGDNGIKNEVNNQNEIEKPDDITSKREVQANLGDNEKLKVKPEVAKKEINPKDDSNLNNKSPGNLSKDDFEDISNSQIDKSNVTKDEETPGINDTNNDSDFLKVSFPKLQENKSEKKLNNSSLNDKNIDNLENEGYGKQAENISANDLEDNLIDNKSDNDKNSREKNPISETVSGETEMMNKSLETGKKESKKDHLETDPLNKENDKKDNEKKSRDENGEEKEGNGGEGNNNMDGGEMEKNTIGGTEDNRRQIYPESNLVNDQSKENDEVQEDQNPNKYSALYNNGDNEKDVNLVTNPKLNNDENEKPAKSPEADKNAIPVSNNDVSELNKNKSDESKSEIVDNQEKIDESADIDDKSGMDDLQEDEIKKAGTGKENDDFENPKDSANEEDIKNDKDNADNTGEDKDNSGNANNEEDNGEDQGTSGEDQMSAGEAGSGDDEEDKGDKNDKASKNDDGDKKDESEKEDEDEKDKKKLASEEDKNKKEDKEDYKDDDNLNGIPINDKLNNDSVIPSDNMKKAGDPSINTILKKDIPNPVSDEVNVVLPIYLPNKESNTYLEDREHLKNDPKPSHPDEKAKNKNKTLTPESPKKAMDQSLPKSAETSPKITSKIQMDQDSPLKAIPTDDFKLQEKSEIIDSAVIDMHPESTLESSKGPKKPKSDPEKKPEVVVTGQLDDNDPNQVVFEFIGDDDGGEDKDNNDDVVDNPFETVDKTPSPEGGDSRVKPLSDKKVKGGGKGGEPSGSESDFGSDFKEENSNKKSGKSLNKLKKFKEGNDDEEEDILETKPIPSKKSILKDNVPFLEDKSGNRNKPIIGNKNPKRGKRVSFQIKDGTSQANEIDNVRNNLGSKKNTGQDRVSSLDEQSKESDFSLQNIKQSMIPKKTNFELENFHPKKTANISLMEAYNGDESDDSMKEINGHEGKTDELNILKVKYKQTCY